jgi:hypothetical protein
VRIKQKGKSHSAARKTEINGILFDSKFEAERYKELRLLEMAGLIRKLECHKAFPLERGDIVIRELRGNGIRRYTADFTYLEKGEGAGLCIRVVEDTKGRVTGEASLRMSVFKALYPQFDFRVIKQGKRKKRLTKR